MRFGGGGAPEGLFGGGGALEGGGCADGVCAESTFRLLNRPTAMARGLLRVRGGLRPWRGGPRRAERTAGPTTNADADGPPEEPEDTAKAAAASATVEAMTRMVAR